MNLTIFFDPIDDEIFHDNLDATCIGGQMIPHIPSGFPNWTEAEIALIGLQDYRGEEEFTCAFSADQIRSTFYGLARNSSFVSIADLGNLRPGHDSTETRYRLREVCATLLQQNIIPLIIGGSHDLAYGQLLGYESLGFPVEWVNADPKLDYCIKERVPFHQRFMNQLLEHEAHLILQYHHLAYQNYLVEPSFISRLCEQYPCHFMRLGELTKNLLVAEPLLRKADMFTMDLNSISSTHYRANSLHMPFGLSGSEAVQLSYYAGSSHSLSSVGFYGYQSHLDEDGSSAKLASVMLWHFVEGYLTRPNHSDLSEEEYEIYEVDFEAEPKKFLFYRHKIYSDKWWLRTVSQAFGTVDVPCLEQDYLEALNGELPTSWLLALKKYEYI